MGCYNIFMEIIDIHGHIASWPTLEQTEKAILFSCRKYGIAKTFVSNCDAAEFPSVGDETPKNLSSIECFEQTLEFLRAHPKKIRAYFWIRPAAEKVTPELVSYLKANKKHILGLKFHPYCSQVRISDSRMNAYYALAEKLRLPILVHTANDVYSSIVELGKVAKRFPKVRFIAAHMELCSDHQIAIEVMKKHPNIYGDTAWVPFEVAYQALREVGEDRLMFGTDNPIDGKHTLKNPMYQDYFSNSLGIEKSLHEALMGGNAKRFFHLK